MDVVVIPAPTRKRRRKKKRGRKKIIPRSVARAFILPERRNEMAESSEKLKTSVSRWWLAAGWLKSFTYFTAHP
jgi:hypothetical protein